MLVPLPAPTCVRIPDLDAPVVQACCEQQLVLPKFEAVPFYIDTAALLLGHRGPERQAPHNVTTVYDMLTRLVLLPPVTVLPWKSCTDRICNILCAMQQAGKQTIQKNSIKSPGKQTEQQGL